MIDFGTATTFDLVDEKGAYIGGVIAPGVNLSIDALYQAAARLPLIDPSQWSESMPVHGRSTIDAMNAGLFTVISALSKVLLTELSPQQAKK